MRFVLLEAFPWKVSDGSIAPVRLAGGGAKPYAGLRGFNDWRAGVQTDPRFVAGLGYGENGWTGGAVPQQAQVIFFPADQALMASLSSLYLWIGAVIEIRSGDDDLLTPVYVLELKGTIAAVSFKDGALAITVTDLSRRLDDPFIKTRFAGTGGIEGPAEAEGRPKRRSFGVCRNVEGLILDKVSNIYEFGDPAFPINEFIVVRDKGREASPAPTVITWQGSIAATFAALQASTPFEGSCVVAPSIACVKWWTVPSGPLTADLGGDLGAGYVYTAASVAERILSAAGFAVEGPELVNNGSFDNATGWTLAGNAAINNGVLKFTAGAGQEAMQVLSSTLASGTVIRYSFNRVQGDAGGLDAAIVLRPRTAGGLDINPAVAASSSTVEPVTGTLTLGDVTGRIGFAGNGSRTNWFDNLSVREILPSIPAGDIAAINAARTAIVGIHVGDDRESTASLLDRLLLSLMIAWRLDPSGQIRLAEINLASPNEVITAQSVDRIENYRPVNTVKLGYKRNHREHSDGEISAILLASAVDGIVAGNMIPSPVLLDRVGFSNGAYLYTNPAATGRNADRRAVALNTTAALARWEADPKAIPVLPGEQLFLAYVIAADAAFSDTANASVSFYGANGAPISSINLSSQTAITGTAAHGVWKERRAVFTVPAGVAFCIPYVERPVFSGAGTFYASEPYLGRTELGADVTAAVNGVSVISIGYESDSTTALSGQLPRTEPFKLIRNGLDVTGQATWSVSTIAGTISRTIGSSNGSLSVTALGTNEATIRVSAVHNGLTRTLDVVVKKEIAATSNSGGGGGSGGTNANDTSLGTTNTTSHVVISDVLTITLGTSVTQARLIAALSTYCHPGYNGNWPAAAKVQWESSPGTWTDVNSEVNSNPHGYTYTDFEGITYAVQGALNFNVTKTGLVAGSTHKFRFVARCVGHTESINYWGEVIAKGDGS